MSRSIQKLHDLIRARRTPALVGLDPRWELLPDSLRRAALGRETSTAAACASAFREFCCGIIDVVGPLVPAVKPQVAFFEQFGVPGMTALQEVIGYARKAGLYVIADAKRGDIGSTAEGYAAAWLAGEDPEAAPFAADALTVNPYLGVDTLQPFLKVCQERGAAIYVLVRTSNPGAADFQDRRTERTALYEAVADRVQAAAEETSADTNYGCCGAVVGATWPQELRQLRERMPNVPFLVPGYGSQGGSAADVAGAFCTSGLGALINSSRAINFAWRRDEYADQFSEDQWQDAVAASAEAMIADLARETPAGRLIPEET